MAELKELSSKRKYIVVGVAVAAVVLIAIYVATKSSPSDEPQSAKGSPTPSIQREGAQNGIASGGDLPSAGETEAKVSSRVVYSSEQLKLNEKTFDSALNTMLGEKTFEKPSREVLANFEKMGFKLAADVRTNPYTGTRTVNEQKEPHDGMFDVNVQYVSGSDGKETLEGIRMSISSADGAYEKQMEKVRGELSPEWKEVHKSESSITWLGPDGYIFWMKRYDEKDPPPAGGNVDVIRMGYEPSND